MTELQAIARVLRRPEEQLRVSYDLLRQGYAPEFLATYRADETGQIDRDSLKKMRRLSDYFLRVENHRRFVKDLLSSEQLWGEQLEAIVREASTVAEIDLVTRGLRSKKSSRALVEKQSEVSRLGQAILTLEGEPPQDLVAWVAQEAKVDLEEANVLLAQVRRWLQLLLHEEPKLLDRIAKHLRRKSIVTVTMLQNVEAEEVTSAELTSSSEPAGKEHAESDQESATQPQSEPLIEPEATTTDEPTLAESTPGASTASESFESSPSVGDPVQHGEVAAQDEGATEGEGHATPEANEVRSSSEGGEGLTLTFAAPKPKRPLKKSKAKAQTPKPKSDANLSPRQRRRRWLRSVLESYAKLRKPLDRLSPYQISCWDVVNVRS